MPMPSIKLDGKEIPFEKGDTIIRAAWRVGVEIPHYCWHPGLSVAANCRMCLVEIDAMPTRRQIVLDVLQWDPAKGDYVPGKKPKLEPACQAECMDGMVVKSDRAPLVALARKRVQEFLLLNHPVDCPICDQAGECKLQDYWLENQKTSKRMLDEPVHKPKAVIFGDTIVYDAERCIVCTRCVRFMEEVAKDAVLDKRERGNLGEIVVSPGRKLEGHYTMMVDHVCPVGALTTKDFRFKARVWFLRKSETVCTGCATGCNAWLDYDPRTGEVPRLRPRDNEQVNKFWMCDDGILTHRRAQVDRITQGYLGRSTEREQVRPGAALEEAAKVLSGAKVAVVLSAQHSSEDNYVLAHFARTVLGVKEFYLSRLNDWAGDDILRDVDHNPKRARRARGRGWFRIKPMADLSEPVVGAQIGDPRPRRLGRHRLDDHRRARSGARRSSRSRRTTGRSPTSPTCSSRPPAGRSRTAPSSTRQGLEQQFERGSPPGRRRAARLGDRRPPRQGDGPSTLGLTKLQRRARRHGAESTPTPAAEAPAPAPAE